MTPPSNISMLFTNRQFGILLNLYKSSFSNFDSLHNLQTAIVKAIVEGLTVSRASIWIFDETILKCEILFNNNNKTFENQFDLNKRNFPNYFNAIQSGLALTAVDAQNEEWTCELNESYLIPLNIKSMFDVPLRENGMLVGILCCENVGEIKNWSENDMAFARSIADIYTLFLEEYKRRLVERTLLDNQERFKFISENISDGIYIIENNKLLFVSKIYLEMIGMTEEEKLNFHNQDMFSLVHPEDVEQVKQMIYSATDKKLPSVKYQHRCKRKDGSYMWREDIMNIHYDASGNAFRAITIARDITAEKEAEIDLIKKNHLAELQNRLLLSLYASSYDKTFDEKVKSVTTIAAEGLFLDRASYWEIEGSKLVCKNLFDKIAKNHSKNQILDTREIPKYIKVISNHIPIVANDVYTHDATIELIDSYLKPLGITDMLDIPIRAEGAFFGVLCCEHSDDPREWSENDIAFARALADYLSIAIEEEKRKVIEQKLIENKKTLDFIANNTSDGILIIEDRIATYVSPTFEKLSGYDKEFVVGISIDNIFNYIHPDDLESLKNVIYPNLEKKNKRFNYQYRFLGTNGKYYWREDYANVVYKEDSDDYEKMIIMSRDIHERKLAELELIENQEQLRLIFENSTDGFIAIEDNKVKYVSPSYRELLGFTEEESIDFPVSGIFGLIHSEDAEKVKELIRTNIAKQNKTFSFVFRIKDKYGKYHWREDIANVIYKTDGSYFKYIVNSRDIDERKIIEEQLIESEKQLRLITENTSDGVTVIENGLLTYVSPSFSKLLGYEKEYYTQMTIEDVFDCMHPDDVDRVRATVYGGLAQQKADIQYEHRFRGADGTYHWREDSANVLYDENGKYTKYIVVTRDISARKEAEKEKNKLHKITEKQNEKLVNFTHIVSHDIRSHTSNLSMILDMYEETEDENERKEYFSMLKLSTEKLSDTIFVLNETVAVQNGLKTEKTKLNIKKEIEKALVGVNAMIKINEVKVEIDIAEDLNLVASKPYLESIFSNLLTNAIKYKSSDKSPILKIRAEKVADETKISFADNGIGIDLEKNKDKIFGMYKTFHGNPDAVGLGLFMVKNHIESMGGRIEVESKIGKGTTFNLYFL